MGVNAWLEASTAMKERMTSGIPQGAEPERNCSQNLVGEAQVTLRGQLPCLRGSTCDTKKLVIVMF